MKFFLVTGKVRPCRDLGDDLSKNKRDPQPGRGGDLGTLIPSPF